MTVAGALMLGATVAACAVPMLLHRLTRSMRDSTAAIIWWLVSIVGVLATFALGARLLLMPGDQPSGTIVDLAHGCWTAVRHGRLPQLDEAVGAAGSALLVVLCIRFAAGAGRSVRAQRRIHRAHVNMLAILGRVESGPTPVLWLDSQQPFAYSVDGRPGLVVASAALRRLPRRQVAAVLCHERAHLRGRHHRIVIIAEAMAAALPVVPLFRQAPAALRLQIEFAADAAAVRRYGPDTVRAALLALTAGQDPDQTPGMALGMAAADITQRLHRIDGPHNPAGNFRLAASRCAAAVTPALAPALLGLATLAAALTLSCPGT